MALWLELFAYLGVTSPLFWVSLALALTIFVVWRKTRRRVAWCILIFLPFLTMVACTFLIVFGIEDLGFNLLSSLTHKVRVYPVECKGKVVIGGPSNGGLGGLCCGSLSIPLNPTTYTVSVSRQQVFAATVTPMDWVLENCEVQDIFNWQCTTYLDANGNETDTAHGECFHREIMQGGVHNAIWSGGCPGMNSPFKRDYVYVDGNEWWTGKVLDSGRIGRGFGAAILPMQLKIRFCANRRG